jgi:hypothetical protein
MLVFVSWNILLLVLISCTLDLESVYCTSLLKEENCHNFKHIDPKSKTLLTNLYLHDNVLCHLLNSFFSCT